MHHEIPQNQFFFYTFSSLRSFKEKYYRSTPHKCIVDVWQKNAKIRDTIKACVDSMAKRITQIIKAKGGVTKY